MADSRCGWNDTLEKMLTFGRAGESPPLSLTLYFDDLKKTGGRDVTPFPATWGMVTLKAWLFLAKYFQLVLAS